MSYKMTKTEWRFGEKIGWYNYWPPVFAVDSVFFLGEYFKIDRSEVKRAIAELTTEEDRRTFLNSEDPVKDLMDFYQNTDYYSRKPFSGVVRRFIDGRK